MQGIEQLTRQVSETGDLSSEEAEHAARLLAAAETPHAAKREFLLALGRKGESGLEVAAFARVFRGYTLDPGVGAWATEAIDVCGTGGDGAGTFNISTAVGFLTAACGVPVLKHGNRSITSASGSADLLETFGIPLEAGPELYRRSLEELGFCFFFAPGFHPAFKEVMPVRKALAEEGARTIFNLLGPLINPGRPAYQLLGVYSGAWVQPMAEALEKLGLKSGLVVHGTTDEGAPLDELSCAGANEVAGFGEMAGERGVRTAEQLGLPPCPFSDLSGGDKVANAGILRTFFEESGGGVPAGLRNSILLNTGAALWIRGRAGDWKTGIEMAEQALLDGTARRWIHRLVAFYENLKIG